MRAHTSLSGKLKILLNTSQHPLSLFRIQGDPMFTYRVNP